jgi:hypothetical protein
MIIFKPQTYSNKFLPINDNNFFIKENDFTVRKIKHLFGPFYRTTDTVFLASNFLPTQMLINPNPLTKLNIKIESLKMEIEHVSCLSDYDSPGLVSRNNELNSLFKERERMLA